MRVVGNRGPLGVRRTRPAPESEGGLQRLLPGIAVQVSGTGPLKIRRSHLDLHAADRREGPPTMAPLRVQGEAPFGDGLGHQPDPAANPTRQRNGDLLDLDGQRITVPAQRRGAYRQSPLVSFQCTASSLRHGPARPRTVERDVQTQMVRRILSAGPGVVRREHAADKGDDRQSMAPVVAEGVQVPPAIATRDDRRLEVESFSRHATAKRPDSAAIGTPGPGCTLPPAR